MSAPVKIPRERILLAPCPVCGEGPRDMCTEVTRKGVVRERKATHWQRKSALLGHWK